MLKTHELHFVIVNHIQWNYHFHKEKRDINGNSRFRVFIIDPEGPAVYERIFKCYAFEIGSVVQNYIENYLEEDLSK